MFSNGILGLWEKEDSPPKVDLGKIHGEHRAGELFQGSGLLKKHFPHPTHLPGESSRLQQTSDWRVSHSSRFGIEVFISGTLSVFHDRILDMRLRASSGLLNGGRLEDLSTFHSAEPGNMTLFGKKKGGGIFAVIIKNHCQFVLKRHEKMKGGCGISKIPQSGN